MPNVLVVVTSHAAGFVDRYQHIISDKGSITQYLDLGTIAVEQLSVLRYLSKLDLGHVHERVDLEPRALKVLDAKCVYRYDFDTRLVADFKDLEVVSVDLMARIDMIHIPEQELQSQDDDPLLFQSCGLLRIVYYHP